VIHGPPGTGKTTVAKELQEKLPWTAYIGVDHLKRFISLFREHPEHGEISRQIVYAIVPIYLEYGINVILEQVLSEPEINA
jgi:adenylate kinase family enzyme